MKHGDLNKKKSFLWDMWYKAKYFPQVSCLNTAEEIAGLKIYHFLGSGLRGFHYVKWVCWGIFLARMIFF